MVRLKELKNSERVKFIEYFNSTMVRLKVMLLAKFRQSWRHFNSTMVRLKGGQRFIATEKLEFQFHYGSVKDSAVVEEALYDEISIPLWFG